MRCTAGKPSRKNITSILKPGARGIGGAGLAVGQLGTVPHFERNHAASPYHGNIQEYTDTIMQADVKVRILSDEP